MVVSNYSDFRDTGIEKYTPTKEWNVCWTNSMLKTPNICPAGEYTVYVKYYTSWGKSSDIVKTTIIYDPKNIQSDNVVNTSNISTSKYLFKNNLKIGQHSEDIRQLQILLNQDSNIRLADSGHGSSGNETNFFGSLTKSAVIRFQEKYAKEILSPWGLTYGTGYVGKTTLEKLNEMGRILDI